MNGTSGSFVFLLTFFKIINQMAKDAAYKNEKINKYTPSNKFKFKANTQNTFMSP